MEKHERHLTDRDLEILEFVNRYRIGTNTLLRDHCFDSESGLKNVERVLLRLERRQLLKRFALDAGRSFYTMTRRGMSLITDGPRTPRPLSEQTLPIVLATATYCVANGIRRLTRQEFEETFPELSRPGIRSSSYTLVKTDDGIKLEMLVVDRGGAAHRIRSRVRRIVAQRKTLPRFCSLMRIGNFRITVLTGTPEQQGKILRRVGGNKFAPIEVKAVVLPELADILMIRK